MYLKNSIGKDEYITLARFHLVPQTHYNFIFENPLLKRLRLVEHNGNELESLYKWNKQQQRPLPEIAIIVLFIHQDQQEVEIKQNQVYNINIEEGTYDEYITKKNKGISMNCGEVNNECFKKTKSSPKENDDIKIDDLSDEEFRLKIKDERTLPNIKVFQEEIEKENEIQ